MELATMTPIVQPITINRSLDYRFGHSSHIRPSLNILFTQLPRELQAEIFLHCISKKRPPRLRSYDIPLVFLRVCKAWRNLALSTPRLWSCFEVTFDDESGIKHKANHLLFIVAQWLSRSGDVPLSVTLSYDPPSSIIRGQFNTAAQAVLKLLLNCSYRWECITLRVPGATLIPLIESAPHNFERLQKFELDLQGGWCAPSFRVEHIGVDWSQLTELHLLLETGSILTLDECWDILAQATGLVECVMNAQCIFQRQRQPNVLPLPLERFQLTLQDEVTGPATSLVCFLNSLDLPLLSELSLRWLVRETIVWNDSQSTFADFLKNLQVEVLHLAYLPVSEEQLLELLHCVPFVNDLSLQFSISSAEDEPVSSSFFQALSRTDDPLLPELERMHIECSGTSWSSKVLITALDSRLRAGLKFSIFVSERAEALSDIFERWNWQGLDVCMRCLTIR